MWNGSSYIAVDCDGNGVCLHGSVSAIYRLTRLSSNTFSVNFGYASFTATITSYNGLSWSNNTRWAR